MFSLSIRTMQFEPAKTWLLLGSPEGVGSIIHSEYYKTGPGPGPG